MNRSKVAALVFLALFAAMMLVPMVGTVSSAQSDPNVTIYAHKNSSSLNSGSVGNTTSLFHSSAQTVSAGATSTSQLSTSWDLYPCLASSITINSGNIVFTAYLTGNGSVSGVTLGAQVNEITTCGTGTETTLFGGEQTTTIAITSTETKFQVNVPVSSQTTIPSGDSIHFIVYVNPNTVDTQTITLYYDASASNTNFLLPLSVSPVTVNSLTLSPTQIVSPGTSTATLSVSDAFGLYDIASSTLAAGIPDGVSTIITQAMTPSSSNSPSAYTGTWTSTVNPSATSYSSFTGLWSIQSHVTDQSSNSYSSSVQQLNYQISGGSGSTISTTTGIASPPPQGPNLVVLAVIAILVAGLGVWAIVRRR